MHMPHVLFAGEMLASYRGWQLLYGQIMALAPLRYQLFPCNACRVWRHWHA